jgi:hypothetical protein
MSVLSSMRRGLNSRQMANAAIIEEEFRRAGLSANWAAAAIVNAIHESNLREDASNQSGEDSVGLFQLNAAGGLGRGMTFAQRADPRINTRTVIREIKRLGLASAGNRSVPELARVFANKIERCAACGYQGGSSQLDKREATAGAFFPPSVSYGIVRLPLAAPRAVRENPLAIVAAVGGLFATTLLLGYLLRRRTPAARRARAR